MFHRLICAANVYIIVYVFIGAPTVSLSKYFKGKKVKYLLRVQQSMVFRLYLQWQWTQSSLQLMIQQWICAPGRYYSWVDRGSAEYEICPALLHSVSTENRTPALLILSPTLYPRPHDPISLLSWYFFNINIAATFLQWSISWRKHYWAKMFVL